MDELDLDAQENSLVHALPYETMRDLSRILDGGETWIELGIYSVSIPPFITKKKLD